MLESDRLVALEDGGRVEDCSDDVKEVEMLDEEKVN